MTFVKPGSTGHKDFLLPTDCSKEEAEHAFDLSDFVDDVLLSDEEFRSKLPDSTCESMRSRARLPARTPVRPQASAGVSLEAS